METIFSLGLLRSNPQQKNPRLLHGQASVKVEQYTTDLSQTETQEDISSYARHALYGIRSPGVQAKG